MFVVTATLCISPGHMPAVTKAATGALQASQARACCLWMLSAELGEANTLLCAFAAQPLPALLECAAQWIAAVRATDAGAMLRHADTDAYSTEASAERLRDAGTGASTLLQELGSREAMAIGASVCLTRLTGTLGRHLIVTPTATHDEALAISRRTIESDDVEVIDSSLWMPVRIQPHESSSQ